MTTAQAEVCECRRAKATKSREKGKRKCSALEKIWRRQQAKGRVVWSEGRLMPETTGLAVTISPTSCGLTPVRLPGILVTASPETSGISPVLQSGDSGQPRG